MFGSGHPSHRIARKSRCRSSSSNAHPRFSVSYTLGEYLSMVRQHVGFLLRHAPPEVRRRNVACRAGA
jgi:hypothetical protein